MRRAFHKREDKATPADWAAMSQMLDAHPAFSNAGAGGGMSTWLYTSIIAVSVGLLGTGIWYFTGSDNPSTIAEQNNIETPTVALDGQKLTSSPQDLDIEETSIERESQEEKLTSTNGQVFVTAQPERPSLSQLTHERASHQLASNPERSKVSNSVDQRVEQFTSGGDLQAFERTAEYSKPASIATGAISTSSVTSSESTVSSTAQENPSETPSYTGTEVQLDAAIAENMAAETLIQSSSSEPTGTELPEGMATTEDQPEAAPAPVIRRPEQWRWSVAAFVDYMPNTTTSLQENSTTNAGFIPLGGGLEWRGQFSHWSASVGLAYDFNAWMMERTEAHESEHIQYSQWAEFDSVQVYEVDSTWIITGINQGYWQMDTTVRYEYRDVVRERYDTNATTVYLNRSMQIRHSRFSMPLVVGYHWKHERWSMGLELGPILTYSNATVFFNGEYEEQFQQVGIDALSRLELGYEIHPSWMLFTRVGLRTNLTGDFMRNARSLERWNWPVQMGIRHQF